MKILKCLLMIVTAPAILVLTIFVWLCTGLIYISSLVLGLLSTVIALLGVAVLIILERLHQQPPRVRTGENRRTGQKGIC